MTGSWKHAAEPIELNDGWTLRRVCRVCAFNGRRVVIQRRGPLRRWRHVQ